MTEQWPYWVVETLRDEIHLADELQEIWEPVLATISPRRRFCLSKFQSQSGFADARLSDGTARIRRCKLVPEPIEVKP